MSHRPPSLRAALTVVALLASATAHAAPTPTSPAATPSSPAPGSSTAAPISSTSAPVSSTAAPVSSTAAPVSSISAPISSTAAPISSTAAPISSTAAPISSTSATVPPASTAAAPGSPTAPPVAPAAASPTVTAPPTTASSTTPARPPIARSPPVAPPPPPRLRLRNPRADSRLHAALALYGATQGLGVLVEYMPHWVASFGLGLGGTARLINTTTPLAAGTVHAELNLLPIPFVVTPVIGGGFGVTFGPLAANLPGIAGRAPDRDQSIRLLPYARFGLRIELPRKFHIVGEVLLVPDNRLKQGHEIHPLPGLRIGLSVL